MSAAESVESIGDEEIISKKEKKEKNYGVWTKKEELELIDAMKNAKAAGMKSKSGFRPGGLACIQLQLQVKFPGTDLRIKPHIVNRIRAWKSYHSAVLQLKMKSGVG